MALIKCPECGHEMSSLADACPHCGCPARFFGGGVQLKLDDHYVFGRYGGEEIEWRVLDVRDGRALLVTEKVIDRRPYHSAGGDITWSKCSLRAWLNGEFLDSAFDASERSRIAETLVSNPDNPVWGTPGGPDTRDRVFCLSIAETARYYSERYPTEAQQMVHILLESKKGIVFWWWLRSPGHDAANAAFSLFGVDSGSLVGHRVHEVIGVRPALWVNL